MTFTFIFIWYALGFTPSLFNSVVNDSEKGNLRLSIGGLIVALTVGGFSGPFVLLLLFFSYKGYKWLDKNIFFIKTNN
jgi:hypothetical protein